MRWHGFDDRRSRGLRNDRTAGIEYAGPGAGSSRGRSVRAADAAESLDEAGGEIRRVADARRAESRKDHHHGCGRPCTGAGVIMSVPITQIDISAYTIPTDYPEADGTIEWDSTTVVIVEAHAG